MRWGFVLLCLALASGCAVKETSLHVERPALLTLSGIRAVRIVDDGFVPRTVEIAAGTEVTWANLDARDHTVSFSSIPAEYDIPSGAQARHRFDEAGTYEYASRTAPNKRGHIIVT
jgi:plastocyanin